MPEHDERFSEPLSHASRVEELAWGGLTVREGDRIAYDVTRHDATGARVIERHEGLVVELWRDVIPSWDSGYAEVISDGDEPERAWFHRDQIDAPGTFGAKQDGALF